MRGKNSNEEHRTTRKHQAPAFSVHDEIKRNRRIERNRRIRQAREARRKLFATLLVSALFVITLAAILLALMRVKNVTVSGNTRYSADVIISAAELDGDILPLASDDAVYKKIVLVCPYVNSIELKKSYPSSVEIVVTEAEAVYCADIHGKHYSLDANLRVIEFTDSTNGLIFLTLPDVVTVIEGSKIKFSEDRYNELVPAVLDSLLNDEHTLPFTSINVSDRFSISGIVGGNVKINFGDYNDMPLKLNAASQLLQKSEAEHSKRTLINVSSLSGAGPSMVLDYEGEF
ncbi:MAG: FtsQ-type POTRA domain-containing protein [Clostridia bacterium]|nr:FtsQ-type POTRA domain-containing protein [Clostridia bacterium]